MAWALITLVAAAFASAVGVIAQLEHCLLFSGDCSSSAGAGGTPASKQRQLRMQYAVYIWVWHADRQCRRSHESQVSPVITSEEQQSG